MQQNQVNGDVVVTVGDRDYVLSLSGRAARIIFEKIGLDIYRKPMECFEAPPDKLNVILWALTQNKGNGTAEKWVTLEDFEDGLGYYDLPQLVEGIGKALTPPDQREQLGNALKEAKAKIGDQATETSGPSADSTSDSPTQNS